MEAEGGTKDSTLGSSQEWTPPQPQKEPALEHPNFDLLASRTVADLLLWFKPPACGTLLGQPKQASPPDRGRGPGVSSSTFRGVCHQAPLSECTNFQ